MESITACFFKVTNIRLVTGLCVVYLIFPLYLLPNIINTGGVGPLDLLFWYNHDTLYQMLTSYGEAVRVQYIIGLSTVDVVYPIFYGTLLVMIIALVIKELSLPFSRKIIFIPYIAVFFDLTENSLLVFLLSHFPDKYLMIADIAGYITAIKWSAFVSIATLIVYIVGYGIRARNKTIKEP